jgi:hypothetical protein
VCFCRLDEFLVKDQKKLQHKHKMCEFLVLVEKKKKERAAETKTLTHKERTTITRVHMHTTIAQYKILLPFLLLLLLLRKTTYTTTAIFI